jgi:hypothetical protein
MYSKCGIAGTITFVGNKKEFEELMGGAVKFDIYKNKFSEDNSIVEYKEW